MAMIEGGAQVDTLQDLQGVDRPRHGLGGEVPPPSPHGHARARAHLGGGGEEHGGGNNNSTKRRAACMTTWAALQYD